jgi:hypothetical protein
MRYLLFLFTILLCQTHILAQDLVLLDGSRSKVIPPGKYLTIEMDAPYEDECECNIKTVYGKFLRTDDQNVVMEIYREYSYLKLEGISTRRNQYYKEGYAVQKSIPKSRILSFKKWKTAKAEKTRETFTGIGALLIISGIGTATTSLVTLETGPRGEVMKAGVGQILAGILLASIYSAKKRYVTSPKSNYHKGSIYRIR